MGIFREGMAREREPQHVQMGGARACARGAKPDLSRFLLVLGGVCRCLSAEVPSLLLFMLKCCCCGCQLHVHLFVLLVRRLQLPIGRLQVELELLLPRHHVVDNPKRLKRHVRRVCRCLHSCSHTLLHSKEG